MSNNAPMGSVNHILRRLSITQGWYYQLGRECDDDDDESETFNVKESHAKHIWGRCIIDMVSVTPERARQDYERIFFLTDRFSDNVGGCGPRQRRATAVIPTLLSWSRLATTCRSHIIEQEQFESALAIEEGARFGSLETGSTERLSAQSAFCTPLICLRRLFLMRHTMRLIDYIEKQDGGGQFGTPIHTGTAHLDDGAIEMEKYDCYPFPMYNPSQWRINHYPCPKEILDLPVDTQTRNAWEAVIAPIASTFRYLEGAIASNSYMPAMKYDHLQDRWRLLGASSSSSKKRSITSISIVKAFSEFSIPLPVSLRQAGSEWVDLRDLFVNGMALFATVLFRLYMLHRLLFVAKDIDDRCLCHVTQLLIDGHIPVWDYVTNHCVWSDVHLMKPIGQRRVDELPNQAASQPAKHPLAPNALNEHAGVSITEAPHPALQLETTPQIMMIWPSSTRWSVTVEESPHLMSALGQSGYLYRYSHEHTAIQNWDDPKTAFVIFFVSKMSMVRSFLRGDLRKAQECFERHPVFATTLLYYLHLVQLGNIPGVMSRPAFTTRLRLWSGYRTSRNHSRDANWTANHCFSRYRYATRFAMHELACFFMQMIPALRNTLFSHPHQGIMYREWTNIARTASADARRRLELLPFTDTTEILDTFALAHDMYACRNYNSTNKHLNFARRWGTFAEHLELMLSKFYSSLLSRVDVTLRAFNRDHAPQTSSSSSSASNGNFVYSDSGPPEQQQQQQQQQQSDDREPDDVDMQNDTEAGFDEDGDGDANFDADDGTGGGGADDIDLEWLLAQLDFTDVENADSNQPESERSRLWSYARPQMRAIHRKFLDSLLYVASLDDPENSEADLCFKKICWLIQRYHGARNILPVMFLGYFGLSQKVAEYVHMLQIYYEQAAPYNRMNVMIIRLWRDHPRDFALLWRYLQYIRLFTCEQGLLLPVHIAKNQLLAREHAAFSSHTGAMITIQRLREKVEAGTATAFERESLKRTRESVECFYYCAGCRGWAHQIAPESATYYSLESGSDKFAVRRALHSQMSTLVNSAAKLIRPPSRAKSAANSGLYNLVSSHAAKFLYRTENWRMSAINFLDGNRYCTCDIRRRVTTAMGVKISQSVTDQSSRMITFPQSASVGVSEDDAKKMATWHKYARLVSIFPLRSALVISMNKKLGIYPELIEKIKRGECMITSVTAANKQPLIDTFTIDSVRGGGGRGGGGSSSSGTDIYDEFGEDEDIGEDPVESDQATTTAATKSTLSPTDAANIAALDPAVRDLLGNYWLNDPRLRFGTTDGMVHSEILDETLPVIREAAKATTVADATLVCGYKLTPVTLVGRMWNLPTQYTCIWRNYTCCSICGALMLAFEWNYITSWGYVCTRHTGLKPVEVNTGSGLYSSRLASTLPNRLSGGSAHDLQMQTRYFVSQTRQLNGIPQPWLEAYGYKNIYEAAGVAESSGLQDYGEENSDWSTSNDFCDCCVEESTASSSDRPVDYYTHVIYLIEINKTNGTVRHRRYCQRHYRTMCSKRKQ